MDKMLVCAAVRADGWPVGPTAKKRRTGLGGLRVFADIKAIALDIPDLGTGPGLSMTAFGSTTATWSALDESDAIAERKNVARVEAR